MGVPVSRDGLVYGHSHATWQLTLKSAVPQQFSVYTAISGVTDILMHQAVQLGSRRITPRRVCCVDSEMDGREVRGRCVDVVCRHVDRVYGHHSRQKEAKRGW